MIEKDTTFQLPSFNTFSFAVVISGSARFETIEYGEQDIEEHRSYYILPKQEARIIKTSEEELVVFLANCDL